MAILLVVSFGLSAVLAYLLGCVGSRERNLPTGPPTLPLLGNILQMPTHHAYLKLTKWAKLYGGMYSLKIGTGTMIVLTDRRLVKQLIDRKSAIYSKRPPSYLNQQITGGDHLLVMDYSNKWRALRRLIHQYFMESMVVNEHTKVVDAEAVQMCRDILVAPEDHMLHPRRFSNSIAMSLIYGVRTPATDTPHMDKLVTLLEKFSEVMEIGNAPPVDQIPALKYVPEFLLGNWKTRARDVSKQMNALYSQYLDKVIQRRGMGVNKGSFMDGVLDQETNLVSVGIDRHQLYFLGGTMMEGGSDTSASIINAFIQAMTKWPEVMKKAQREIDKSVGEDRSPTFNDYADLPYVAATVKEAMRWRPVGALGFPHCVSEDDWIDGKLIPKGATILINVWGMHHDEKYFQNPDVFDPDRFAGFTKLAPELAAAADYKSRDHYGYGAGRRLCPGIHLAERNLFVGMAKLLWAFDISPGKDAEGFRIEPDVDVRTAYSAGLLMTVKPFECRTEVRSQKRRETILREFSLAEQDVFARYQD